MNCCTPPIAEDYDDYSKYTASTGSSDSSQSSEDSEVLNTSYKHATPLFREIEKENWTSVLLFLKSGKWNDSFFASTNAHMRSPGAHMQAKTWVTAYDRNGDPEWSQLPLHAAISYSAPFVIIQKLVELYPRAMQCTDNEGMLPIHLAYGFGAADDILAILLEPFPSSVNEKGLGGRYPYECCELGPNKVRGKVYKIVSEQITNRVTADIHNDWKKFAMAAQESVGLKKKEDMSDKNLHEVLLALLKERKELQDIKEAKKKNARSPKAAISPKIATSPKAASSPKGKNSGKNGGKNPSTPASTPSKRNGGRRSGWGKDK